MAQICCDLSWWYQKAAKTSRWKNELLVHNHRHGHYGGRLSFGQQTPAVGLRRPSKFQITMWGPSAQKGPTHWELPVLPAIEPTAEHWPALMRPLPPLRPTGLSLPQLHLATGSPYSLCEVQHYTTQVSNDKWKMLSSNTERRWFQSRIKRRKSIQDGKGMRNATKKAKKI